MTEYVVPFFHRWEQSRKHKVPLNHSPTGHEQVKETWTSLTTENPDRWCPYLHHTAVDTNHVESTFFISDEVGRFQFDMSTMALTSSKSIRDIIRQGIDAAHIVPLPTSPLDDPEVIRQIIKDTVFVSYFYVLLLVRWISHFITAGIQHFVRTCS